MKTPNKSMEKKQHPLTKAELREELGKMMENITNKIIQRLDSFHIDKHLERLDTRIELTFQQFSDIMLLLEHDHKKIKELEKRVKELSGLNKS
jgi:hypothetical protein